jgi:hypothetical protein
MRLDRFLLLRCVAGVLALTALVLWILFAIELFALSEGFPAPSGIMLPLYYCCVAGGAFWAAVRDEPVVLVLAGGISLVPGGLFLLMFPGPFRGVALIYIALIVLGVILMRARPEPEPEEPAAPPSGGPSSDAMIG